jgi:hypothetical protein
MSKLKSYLFSCGNSSSGTVGFCARVRATSKKEAVKILHEAMPECESAAPYDHEDAIEYIHFYTNTEAVKESDIEEWEWVDDTEDEED